MFEESFYQTQQSEVFVKSNCMQHEHAVANLFASLLSNLGYTNTRPRTWQRQDRTVIVCLADDFSVCRQSYSVRPAQWFDANTTVLTDNYFALPSDYRILQLPTSYFGVFNYVPEDSHYRPDRRFHLSVNRLDAQRELILLEWLKQLGDIGNDYINFNARIANEIGTVEQAQLCFDTYWQQLDQLHNTDYHAQYLQARDLVPIRNHNLSIEQANVSAYVNVVVETYAGDATIGFSEKIFRALVTPAPWTVYSARGAVSYLRKLGFDVLDDIVDHSYDNQFQDTSYFGISKIRKFIQTNQEIYQRLVGMDLQNVADRCKIAAQHNQQHLASLAQRWPQDFAAWLPGVIEIIQ
jgi:hypothetical protein